MMEMSQARRGVVDETWCEWMTFRGAQIDNTSPVKSGALSHAHARVKVEGARH